MQTVVDRGAHPSAKKSIATHAYPQQAVECAAESECPTIKWNSLKSNPPPNLKIFLIAAFSHKSCLYQMILVMLFKLTPVDQSKLRSVNDSSDKALTPYRN